MVIFFRLLQVGSRKGRRSTLTLGKHEKYGKSRLDPRSNPRASDTGRGLREWRPLIRRKPRKEEFGGDTGSKKIAVVGVLFLELGRETARALITCEGVTGGCGSTLGVIRGEGKRE